MAVRVGIELSPGVCRIVEVEVARARSGAQASTRIRRFDTFELGTSEFTAALSSLEGRPAAVVVWGAPGDHRQVMVTSGTYDSMRKEASRALTLAGVETRGALIDIARAPIPEATDTHRRAVVVAMASGAAVSAAVQPLLTAGVEITTIATPATALVSLARLRRRFVDASPDDVTPAHGAPGRVDAYIALGESATCIALLRDGTLAAARELSWGFLETRRREPRRRDDVVVRLADELAEFLLTAGGTMASVRHTTLCGGAPALRGIAAALTARFDIEVEPLDAPFSVDATLDIAIRERCADMWMAWAAAVDDRAPLSLVHARRRHAIQVRFARAAVAAGIVAGVAVGWGAARCLLLLPPPVPSLHRTAPRAQPVEQTALRDND
jgi:hypothetical protein